MSIYERPPTFLGSWNMSSPLDTRADAVMARIHNLLWAIHSGAFYTHASHLFNVWLSSRSECCFPKVHGLYWLPSKVACDMDLVINECPYIERPPTFVGSWNMTTPLDTRAIGMLFVMLRCCQHHEQHPILQLLSVAHVQNFVHEQLKDWRY